MRKASKKGGARLPATRPDAYDRMEPKRVMDAGTDGMRERERERKRDARLDVCAVVVAHVQLLWFH